MMTKISVRPYDARKARLKLARSLGNHTPDEWDWLLSTCRMRCLGCGSISRICVDHIVPIADGGSDCITNLQPLCIYCNSIKSDIAVDYRPRWLAVMVQEQYHSLKQLQEEFDVQTMIEYRGLAII